MRERIEQVPPDRRGHDQEQRVYGAPATPTEVDRMLEQEERDLRLRHAKHDRIPHVRIANPSATPTVPSFARASSI